MKAKDEDGSVEGSAVCPWTVTFSPPPLMRPPQMAEHIEGIRVVCEQPLHVQSEDRRMKYCWKFKVHSQVSPALHSPCPLWFFVSSNYYFCKEQKNRDLGTSQ